MIDTEIVLRLLDQFAIESNGAHVYHPVYGVWFTVRAGAWTEDEGAVAALETIITIINKDPQQIIPYYKRDVAEDVLVRAERDLRFTCKAFVHDCLRPAPENRMPGKDAYVRYRDWLGRPIEGDLDGWRQRYWADMKTFYACARDVCGIGMLNHGKINGTLYRNVFTGWALKEGNVTICNTSNADVTNCNIAELTEEGGDNV